MEVLQDSKQSQEFTPMREDNSTFGTIFKREQVKNTPFLVLGIEREGKKEYCLALGKSLVSDRFDNEEECVKQISDINWNLIIHLVLFMEENKIDIQKVKQEFINQTN